jgi:hypothetical protein
MKKGKGTQYQSNAKRRNKTDALGRPMRSPSFGITSTPNGYVVSEFVANQVMRKHPSLIPAFDIVSREKPIFKNGKRTGETRTITKVKPIAFKYAVSVRNAVQQWALDNFAHVERKVMRKANDRHKDLSFAFKRIKNDRFRKNGTIKEDVTIGSHARMIRNLEAAKPPLALIGLEMIKQGIIV